MLSEYRYKAILLDVTHADPQAVGHIRAGSANGDGLTAYKSEARKRSHYARPKQVPFNERSYKLATLAVESFGCLGKGGNNLIDQLAAGIARGTDASALAKKGFCKERLFQIISVTAQVAISRRVHRYQHTLRDRPATRRRRKVHGVPLPMTSGWSIDEE